MTNAQNTLPKAELKTDDFVILFGGKAYSDGWNFFKGERTLLDSENFDLTAPDLLNLDEEAPTPDDMVTHEYLLLAVNSINKRIANGKGFAHFTNYNNPTFMYRLAVGCKRFMGYTKVLAEHEDPQVLIAVGMLRVREKEERARKAQGFSVTGVFSESMTDQSFAYSQNLSDTVGYELICCTSHTSADVIGQVVGFVARSLRDYPTIKTEGTDSDIVKKVGLENYCRLVKVTDENVVKRYGGSTGLLYQIVTSDRRGKFPGDEGYSTEINQTLTDAVL